MKGFNLYLSIGYLVLYLIFVIVVAIQANAHSENIKKAEYGEIEDANEGERILDIAEQSVRAKDF